MRVPDGESGKSSGPIFIEARFHPEGESNVYALVGWIVSHGSRIDVEIFPGLRERLPGVRLAQVIKSLRRLAVMSGARLFDSLRSLDNRHWSFVLVPVGGDG